MNRKCGVCGQPGGPGKRELRPYGRNGTDICAGCVFGNAEREAVAQERMALQFAMAGRVAVIDTREQAGPRRATRLR